MWGAFLVLVLLLTGAPPPPLFGKAASRGVRGFITSADAQIQQTGNAYAVKCVRRGEQPLRSLSHAEGARILEISARIAHAALHRLCRVAHCGARLQCGAALEHRAEQLRGV